MRSTVSGLRLLATDLAAAALQLGVGGLAAGVSWWVRRRQDVVAERARRLLDAERLAEAVTEVWEPHSAFPGCCTYHEPAYFDIEPEPASHGFSGVCPSDGPVCGHGPVSAAVTTPAADNTQLVDHMQELWDYHQPAVGSGMRWFCEGCDWGGESKRAHTRHRLGLVADMKAAEVRVQQRMDGTR